jgi:hypothetical protein
MSAGSPASQYGLLLLINVAQTGAAYPLDMQAE